MPTSALFQLTSEQGERLPVSVEGFHTPDALAAASGVWIASAGSAMLTGGAYPLIAQNDWLLIMCQSGSFTLNLTELRVRNRECCMVPPRTANAQMQVDQEARVIWMTFGGPLAKEFMLLMGALPHRVMKQGALPSQLKLGKHVVQAIGYDIPNNFVEIMDNGNYYRRSIAQFLRSWSALDNMAIISHP